MTDTNRTAPKYLGISNLSKRYGKASRTIHRWMHDSKVNFPAPDLTIRGHRFWDEETIAAFEKSAVAKGGVSEMHTSPPRGRQRTEPLSARIKGIVRGSNENIDQEHFNFRDDYTK